MKHGIMTYTKVIIVFDILSELSVTDAINKYFEKFHNVNKNAIKD